MWVWNVAKALKESNRPRIAAEQAPWHQPPPIAAASAIVSLIAHGQSPCLVPPGKLAPADRRCLFGSLCRSPDARLTNDLSTATTASIPHRLLAELAARTGVESAPFARIPGERTRTDFVRRGGRPDGHDQRWIECGTVTRAADRRAHADCSGISG